MGINTRVYLTYGYAFKPNKSFFTYMEEVDWEKPEFLLTDMDCNTVYFGITLFKGPDLRREPMKGEWEGSISSIPPKWYDFINNNFQEHRRVRTWGVNKDEKPKLRLVTIYS